MVVCQHGLEGRPRDVADPKVNNPAYHQFAVRLAERGFITFAPQNLYIFEDRFRTLQRKANPLGQDAVLDHRARSTSRSPTGSRRCRTSTRRGSPSTACRYGGKSAMRIPPLVKNYCLSICSADFNEWVWKNASTRSPYSYVWTRRVRDLRVRPGQHVQLRRDGRPDRPAAVHGRARPLRRRGPRRDGRLRVRQGVSPLRRQARASATAARSSSSSARTRSTARGRSRSCTST